MHRVITAFWRPALSAAAVIAVIGLAPAPSAAALPAPNGPYVALGDSVAAGIGLSGQEDALCDRTLDAYPRRIAAALNTNVINLACSGAKVDEGMYGEQERNGYDITPQIDQAFAFGTPALMTITIGANDMRWAGYIRDCYTWRCGSALDRGLTRAYALDLRLELHKMFNRIETLSNGAPPRVLISGYYFPFSSTSCGESEGITSTEMSWLRSQTSRLNSTISRSVSGRSYATYVPINFRGHELCSGDPWVQGSRDAQPFHPTATGQQAIADAFLRIRR
ncbi:SGNH/GDSL hydrolase family protein [Candidatus Saccharibacteria bacterium]|nr:SGNH/GDSL hydrolase family protein [Candidatus Saccharibacteria bacterium]